MPNYDQRVPLNYAFGQLSGGVDSLATTLASTAFAALPSDLTTVRYVPIVLADDSQGLYEIVWITGHSASSQSITVVRGREGSAARSWGAGTIWRCAPTARDVLIPYASRAALPGDAHIGMRAFLVDENVLIEKSGVGWAVPLGGTATGRRHGWVQAAGGTIVAGVNVLIGAMSPIAGNGGIATLSGGNLLLNRPGLWSLSLEGAVDYGAANMRTATILKWPNGMFTPKDELQQTAFGTSGFPGCGYAQSRVAWQGYVDTAAAARPINAYQYQNNPNGAAVSNAGYWLSAEYLGG